MTPLNYVFKEVKDRITTSMELKRSANRKKQTKEFWFGFLLALLDYCEIPKGEYRALRNMVDSW